MREAGKDDVMLKRVRLKPSAVPSVFPNLPKYLSKPEPPKRTTSASASAICKKSNALLKEKYDELLLEDAFTSLDSLIKKLSHAKLPTGYTKVINEHSFEFHYILSPSQKQKIAAPKLISSLVVYENMTFKAFPDFVPLSHETFNHLLSSICITTITELCNVLAYCKNLSSESLNYRNNDVFVKLAITALE